MTARDGRLPVLETLAELAELADPADPVAADRHLRFSKGPETTAGGAAATTRADSTCPASP